MTRKEDLSPSLSGASPEQKDAQRARAIDRAYMFRVGDRTIDSLGREVEHDSISAAKRFSRASPGLGKCVAQRKGENLFSVMRERVAAEEAALAEATGTPKTEVGAK